MKHSSLPSIVTVTKALNLLQVNPKCFNSHKAQGPDLQLQEAGNQIPVKHPLLSFMPLLAFPSATNQFEPDFHILVSSWRNPRAKPVCYSYSQCSMRGKAATKHPLLRAALLCNAQPLDIQG